MNTDNCTYNHASSFRMPLFTSLLRWAVPVLFAAVVTSPQAFAAVEFPPALTSTSASSVTANSATPGGDITYLGDSTVTARGVVYAITTLNGNPEIGGANVVVAPASGSANALGAFTVNLSGLNSATGYTFKAFATNTAGTTYGSALTFTTLINPTIISPTSASIGSTTATLGGNVTDDGLSTITERGVVVSPTALNGNPLIGGGNVLKVTTTGTTGVFAVGVTGLNPGTAYSFKAYATNSVGVSYTSPVSTFTTLTVPSLALTPTSASITSSAATLGGNVTSDGLAAITGRGVVYSITAANSSPQIGGSGVTQSTTAGTTGAFTIAATGLANGTTYTFAAYAINSVGTTYSNFGTFETAAVTPTITSPTQTSVTTNAATAVSSATLGGNVTLPGSEVIERGVVYSVTGSDSNPFIGDPLASTKVHANTAGTTGAFTVNLTNLLPYTSYTFKAYVKNSVGTVGYTTLDTFTTPAVAPLVASGSTKAAVTSSSATLGGNVTKTGGRTLDEVGVVYSITGTNGNPLLNGTGVSKVTSSAVTGVFTIPVSGLSANTQYSFKAFAKSAAGTSYSSVATFTTLSETPTVTTPTKASITSSSATLGGNVTKSGGLTISERGVVYALTAQNSNPQVGGANVTKKTTSGTTGTFTVAAAGLQAGKQYSFAAYATTSAGTGYTSVTTFTTVSTEPTVTSPGVDAIFSKKATVGGKVTKDNGAAIMERGVVYALSSQNGNPMIGGAAVKKVTNPGTIGGFTVSLTGLTPAKKYSFAVYATNSVGTTYSPVVAFTTSTEAPTITRPSASSITATTAILGGNVTAEGGADIKKRGVVYSIRSKNRNPLIGGKEVITLEATGSTGKLSVRAAALLPATEYAFKAYATNSAGTSYTVAGSFTTLSAPPTVTSPTSAFVKASTATLGGKVVRDNGKDITERGVVYSLTSVNKRPRLYGEGVLKVTTDLGVGEFTVLVSKLWSGSQYTFAAYAKNSMGISYSETASFTVKSSLPWVKSPTVDEILHDSAILGGHVSRDNGEKITERGVIYTIINTKPVLGAEGVIKKTVVGTTGKFSTLVKNLQPGTQYFFRAYAKNKLGTRYSEVSSFTTKELVDGSEKLAGELQILGGIAASDADTLSDTTETYDTIDPQDGLKYLTIVITKQPGTESQPRTVEVSGNLIEWFSGSSHTTVLSDDAGILKVRDNTPVTPDAKRYIRLKP